MLERGLKFFGPSSRGPGLTPKSIGSQIMKSQNLEVSVKWESSSWVIREAGRYAGPGIKVDALVLQPVNSTPENIRGYIVSVYGVNQEIAKQLGYQDLKALGIGNHLTHRTPMTQLLHLGAEGRVTKGE